DEHRHVDALLGFRAVRRRSVNILRRTCWRIAKNSAAILSRWTAASAVARSLTRFLRLRALRTRHLFGVFFSPEKRSMFFLRLSGRNFFGARFFRRFHLKNKLGRYIVMQLNRDLVLARIFDWALQNNLVPINLRTEL